MADLLAQFDIVERAEQARARRAEGGPGVGRPREPPVNPFDEEEELNLMPSPLESPAHSFPLSHRVSDRVYSTSLEEHPIFRRTETAFPAGPGITHLTVTNNYATMVIIGNVICRFPVKNPRALEQFEIPKKEGDRIHKIFQDPLAQHLVISMDSRECYYLGRSRGSKRGGQPRPLHKVKGYWIESIAWNKVEQTEVSTGPILMGTNNGIILETDIDFQESLLPKKKGYLHEVYHLVYDLSDQVEPITGLHLEPFPDQNKISEVKFFVMATTPKRIYQFIGTVTKGEVPYFMPLFSSFSNDTVQFLEIPGSLKESQLRVWPSCPKERPQSFAWLTGAGIYYGQLGFGDHVPGESLFLEKMLIPYSSPDHSETATPIGMSLTQFHCILLYRDRVEAVCVLNQERVFEDSYNIRQGGPLLALSVDPIDGTMYTNKKHRVWMYVPHNETRDVWKIYLKQEQYEVAKNYARGDAENMETILVSQAEHYFKQQRYHDAALTFSESTLSFEEVTLKFIEVDRKDALKIFLLKKLESLSRKDSTQQTMLTTWLVDLYLNDLGSLKEEGDQDGHTKTQREFHTFLERDSIRQNLENHSKTIYDLLSSHGAVEDMVFFATLMKDYERVISHHIRQYHYQEALTVLRKKASEVLEGAEKERRGKFKRYAVLFYKFSPLLMRHCPQETVDAWVKMRQYLEPKKLIPALVQCSQPANPKQLEASLTYLEFCVEELDNTDRAIHNFLLSTYVTSKRDSKLIKYLIAQAKNPVVTYDPQYALRLCSEHHHTESCVYIYAAMGLHEEAVDLALEVDVELARQIAGSELRDAGLQKKLWLKVAQHVITQENNIEKAMQFLKECSLLKIEDILPFFPDFVTIDHFKDAICTSLSEYNEHIDDLKTEMKGATQSAKNIRADIQEIRNKCVVVESDRVCEICSSRLLVQGFYMFPCQHAFHRDCLIPEVVQYLSSSEKHQLESLLTEETSAGREAIAMGIGRSPIKARIDAIVGRQCLYCGDAMIMSVSQPLIPPARFQTALSSWK